MAFVTIGRFLAGSAIILVMVFSASSQTIWAVHDGLRLEREDLSNTNKASHSVWDGSKIRIFGAKNEIIAFQVIVQAGSQAISGLTAALPRLQQRNGQAAIVYEMEDRPSGFQRMGTCMRTLDTRLLRRSTQAMSV